MRRWIKRISRSLLVLAIGAALPVTTANCDPLTGRFSFYRNTRDDDNLFDLLFDDGEVVYIDNYGYDGFVYYEYEDDCHFLDCVF